MPYTSGSLHVSFITVLSANTCFSQLHVKIQSLAFFSLHLSSLLLLFFLPLQHPLLSILPSPLCISVSLAPSVSLSLYYVSLFCFSLFLSLPFLPQLLNVFISMVRIYRYQFNNKLKETNSFQIGRQNGHDLRDT